MKINCIAIEDEPLALNKLIAFINQVGSLNLLASFDNAIEAFDFIKSHKVDLIFLDIQMKPLSGLEFLESLDIIAREIVTSAYDKYALKGYELNVTDYLLKPFSFERFIKSVDKVCNQVDLYVEENPLEYIFVKSEYRIEKIELNDILFIQGMKDYLQIHTKSKKIMTLQTFKNFSESLPKSKFLRVHNSYIVSISKIDNIERNRIIIGKQMIPKSASYKEPFFEYLKQQKLLI